MPKKRSKATVTNKKTKSDDIAFALKVTGSASETQALEQRSITKTLEPFLLEVDALADTLSLVTPLMADSLARALKDFAIFLGTKCKGTQGTYSVPPDLYSDLLSLKRRINSKANQIIPRSFLTSLVSHYDASLGSLLRAVFYLKPEVLNTSERQFSFKELISFESISAARERMEHKFGVPLTKDLPSWAKFVEVTERRNLFVHCNGIVSTQYLSVCKQHGFDCSKIKVGQELNADLKYFQEAYATIVEIGLKLAHVLWRRLRPEEMEKADTSLNNLCLDLIRDDKYSIAQISLDFAAQYKAFGSEHIRKILILTNCPVLASL